MKKIISLLLVGLFPFVGMKAQENTVEQGNEKAPKVYLPEQGDWSVGVDLVPLIKYIGTGSNNLKGGGGSPFTKGSGFDNKTLMPDASLMGKYMLTDQWALRANLGFKVGVETHKRYVRDDQAAVLNPLGEEKYNYGNEITSVNQHPTTSVRREQSYLIPDGYRVLTEYTTGSNFYTGITGSAGVEWFVVPKISLGAEVNLCVYYLFGRQTYVESEGYNAAFGRVEKRTDLVSPGDKGFYVATESLGGSLTFNFYF